MKLRSATRRATAAPATVIDHQFFPHIIDQIWTYLSVDDLQPLRTVCKDWRIRADLKLSNHLVIERKDTTYDVRVRCIQHPGATESITNLFQGDCQCIDPDLNG